LLCNAGFGLRLFQRHGRAERRLGFIGAGTIVLRQNTVRGLTTAAIVEASRRWSFDVTPSACDS
jgi:hypothetical protein